MKDLQNLRTDYTRDHLHEDGVESNPTNQLQNWLNEAIEEMGPDGNCMSISTVSNEGLPSSRIVLLKEIRDNGELVFYTNYDSKKGQEIGQNAHVALLFFWPSLQRQVRIEGKATKISKEASADYFYQRPEGSQWAAMASPQSQEIASREDLEARLADVKAHADKPEIPAHWGGYAITPTYYEFWQGGRYRLHDRIIYEIIGDEIQMKRLAP